MGVAGCMVLLMLLVGDYVHYVIKTEKEYMPLYSYICVSKVRIDHTQSSFTEIINKYGKENEKFIWGHVLPCAALWSALTGDLDVLVNVAGRALNEHMFTGSRKEI